MAQYFTHLGLIQFKRCYQSTQFLIDLSVNKITINKNNELNLQNPYFRTSLIKTLFKKNPLIYLNIDSLIS